MSIRNNRAQLKLLVEKLEAIMQRSHFIVQQAQSDKLWFRSAMV